MPASVTLEKAIPEEAWVLAELLRRAFDSDLDIGAPGPGGPPGYDDAGWQQRMMRAGDYYSLIVARPDGALLLASYSGVVRIRAKDGAWSERTVTTALPAQKPVAIRDARKPARTR